MQTDPLPAPSAAAPPLPVAPPDLSRPMSAAQAGLPPPPEKPETEKRDEALLRQLERAELKQQDDKKAEEDKAFLAVEDNAQGERFKGRVLDEQK